MNIEDDKRRAVGGMLLRPRIVKRAAVERHTQIARGVQFAARNVRFAGADGIRHLQQKKPFLAQAQGIDRIAAKLIHKDLVVPRRFQHRAALAQRIGGAQGAYRIDDILHQRL